MPSYNIHIYHSFRCLYFLLSQQDTKCSIIYTLPAGERGGSEAYFAETSCLEIFAALFSGNEISSEVLHPTKLSGSEKIAGFMPLKRAIPMENACRSSSDELNSTENIPSLNHDKLKTSLVSEISSYESKDQSQ